MINKLSYQSEHVNKTFEYQKPFCPKLDFRLNANVVYVYVKHITDAYSSLFFTHNNCVHRCPDDWVSALDINYFASSMKTSNNFQNALRASFEL